MIDSRSQLPPRDIDPVRPTPSEAAMDLAQRHLSSQPEGDATPMQQTLGQAARFAAVQATYKEATSKSELPTEQIPLVTTITQAAAKSLRESYRQYMQERNPAPTETRPTKPSRVLGRIVSRFFKK